MRSIRARALLELCESPDRDDELTGSPALKQRVWRKAHDKRVGAVPQTRKTRGRPDAVSDAIQIVEEQQIMECVRRSVPNDNSCLFYAVADDGRNRIGMRFAALINSVAIDQEH